LEAADAAEAAESEVEPDTPEEQLPNEERPLSVDAGSDAAYQPLPLERKEEGKNIVSKYDQKDL
jgi:hypothetical protein